MPDKSDIALDLDALAPKKVQISYQEKTLDVNPPTLEQFVTIMDLAEQMRSIKDNTDFKQTAEVYKQAQVVIVECIPDLKDVNLNFMQITALFELVSKLGAPDDDRAIAELKRRGITIGKPGEKSPKGLASSEQ